MTSHSDVCATHPCAASERARALGVLVILSTLMSFASISTDMYLPAARSDAIARRASRTSGYHVPRSGLASVAGPVLAPSQDRGRRAGLHDVCYVSGRARVGWKAQVAGPGDHDVDSSARHGCTRRDDDVSSAVTAGRARGGPRARPHASAPPETQRCGARDLRARRRGSIRA